jgi:hypothetical protein
MNHINIQNQKERIQLAPIVTSKEVMIKWQFGSRIGVMDLTKARNRATDLFIAISIADVEAVTALKLVKSSGYPSGSDRWKQDLVDCLNLVRNNRPESVDGVAAIFTTNQLEPAIQLSWYGDLITLDLDQAIIHAQELLAVAEAAQTDLYFLSSFKTCGIGAELQDRILSSFEKFRSEYNGAPK